MFLPAQTGDTPGDPAAQADQTMGRLLAAAPDPLTRLTVYLTDRAWQDPVDAVIARHLGDATPARSTVIATGLPDPASLVAIEAETAGLDLPLPGLTDPEAAVTTRRHGGGEAAAAAQAEAVFAQLGEHLARHGAALTDVCKITMQITDRAYRQAVYGVLGRALPGVFPVSTGLIVSGLADPHALFQLEAYAAAGGPHERLRRYRSSEMPYGLHRQSFAMEFCMVVRAGNRIFLRGQTGMTLDGRLVGLNDPAAQARQAVENVGTLLAEVGADLSHATRLVTYVTDRAHLRPVLDEVEPAFAGSQAARTAWIVKGLAAPEILMEIDVHAVL